MSAASCPTPWCAHEDAPYVWQGVDDRYTVICGSCQVEGPYCDTEAQALDAWNDRSAVGLDYKAAWREMHDHLSWMRGCKSLPARYLGMNFAGIANDLIERAYPGLRDGSVDPAAPPTQMARLFIEWMESCWPDVGPQSDFNLGVQRGFEIIRAQIANGHSPLSAEQVTA